MFRSNVSRSLQTSLTSLVTIPSGLKYANFTSMSAFSLTHEVLNASDKEIWPTSCVDVSRQNLSCLCFLFFSFGGSSNADVFRSSRWLCANRQRPPSAPQRPWRNRGHNEVFIKSGRSWRSSSPWAYGQDELRCRQPFFCLKNRQISVLRTWERTRASVPGELWFCEDIAWCEIGRAHV